MDVWGDANGHQCDVWKLESDVVLCRVFVCQVYEMGGRDVWNRFAVATAGSSVRQCDQEGIGYLSCIELVTQWGLLTLTRSSDTHASGLQVRSEKEEGGEILEICEWLSH